MSKSDDFVNKTYGPSKSVGVGTRAAGEGGVRMPSGAIRKLWQQWPRTGNKLRRFVQAVIPGSRAWRGATWGIILITVLVWSVYSYNVFAPAGPVSFVVGTLAPLLVVALLGGILTGLGGLLHRIPAPYRWAVVTALLPLLLTYLALPLAYGTLITVLGLLVFSSLMGAGVMALVRGNWQHRTRLHQGLALTGLLVGGVGLMGGGAFLLVDGFATTTPPNAAAASAMAVTPLSLDDPAQPGPYAVLTLTYGSGEDRHRREYGADVALTTTSVDGANLLDGGGWSQLRQSYWGFGPEAMPRNGRVWYPDGRGPFPLVLIVHGNHLMEHYSDAGYAYLGQLLASRGFIVASIDQNFLNDSLSANMLIISPLAAGPDARGWLLLEHVRQWQEWHNTPGNPFYEQVDLEAIALVGHSRGGEAVAIAAAFSRLAHHPDDAAITLNYDFDIHSVVAIAPMDGDYLPGQRSLPLANVNYLVLQGAHDSDVATFYGARQYMRLHFDDDQPHFKAIVYAYGANHGQFNSDWGRRDLLGPVNQLLNLHTIMPAAEQEQIARVTISAFLEATLHGETGYRALFRDPRTATAWLPDTIYLSQYQDSDTLRLATYEEDIDLRSTTLPGGQLHGENLTIWREQIVPLKYETLDDSAVYLGWDREAEDETAHYTLTLLDNDLGLTSDTVLTFSLAAAAENPDPDADNRTPITIEEQQPLDMTLELVDGRGNRARLPLSHFSLLQPPLPLRLGKADFMNFLPLSAIVYQTFEFPLAAFVAVNSEFDPQTLSRVQFVFDRTPAGVVVLDEVGLRMPANN